MVKIRPSDIKDSLDMGLAIFSPSEENAHIVIDWIMPDIKLDELRQALYYFSAYNQSGDPKWLPLFDPIPRLFKDYQVGKYEIVVRRMGREWWKFIGKFVADRSEVVNYMIEKRPELKSLLYSNSGQAFMDYYTKRLYDFFNTWFHKFPRYHNNCGGVVKYGIVNKERMLWGFFCRRCSEPLAAENLEQVSYMYRKNKIRR